MTYDPYGQPLASLPDNSAPNYDYAWLGQHQRGLEHAGPLSTIEMGARQYSPSLGRFLEVDPIEGGSANDYDYVSGDPVNGSDLDGNYGYTFAFNLQRHDETPEELVSEVYRLWGCVPIFWVFRKNGDRTRVCSGIRTI